VAVGDPDLEESVEKWEPHLALFGGADGLNAYREILAGAKEWLAPGGSIALEIGHRKAGDVYSILCANGFTVEGADADPGGHLRAVHARLYGS